MIRFRLLILLFPLWLTACQPSLPKTQIAARTAPALPLETATLSPTASPTPALPALELKPCTVSVSLQAECGYLRVKEDRSSPNSRELRLYTVVVRAREKDAAADPLFYLTGGPGDPATRGTNNIFNIFAQINQKHDVVFIDQRGTAGGHRIECTPPAFSLVDASQTEVDAFVKQCLSEMDLDVRFYTTAAYAQDLDEARALLGYKKIDLYGISYGVTVAQVYMRLYESRVRAAVLDHGSFLDLPMLENWANNSQLALDRVIARCEKDSACSTAYPNLRAEWKAIMARLDKGPVTVDIPIPGTHEKVKVTKLNLNGIHNLLFDAKKAASLPQIIHVLANTEDWTAIVKSLSDNSSSGEGKFGLLFYTTVCNEGWAGFDEQVIARENASSYLLESRLQDARAISKMCHALPKADSSVQYGAGKPAQTQVLILSGEADPQNPPENMAQAAAFWSNSLQVIEPGLGHITPGVGCRWDVITRFIDQGATQGLDISCITNTPAEPFAIVQ